MMAWRVGLFLFALYLASFGGGPHAVDEIAPMLSAGSLVRRGTLATNELFWTIGAAGNPSDAQVSVGITGDVWSKKGPMVALAMVPWAYLAFNWPLLDQVFTTLLAMVPITAATGGLLVIVARRVGLSSGVATSVGLGYGVATLAWPYARLGFGEPLIAFAVVLAVAVGQRGLPGAFVAGLCIAMAAATKPSAILVGLPIAIFIVFPDLADRLQFRNRIRTTFALCSGALIGLVPLALHNVARFGGPLSTGYAIGSGEDFSVNPAVGLTGLLVSPYRGVIWFVPCVVIAALAIPLARRRAPALTYCAIGIAMITLGTYVAWWTWWGGYAWGPRFLLPGLPLLAVVLGIGWSAIGRPMRVLSLGAIGCSVVVQTLGAFMDFNPFEHAIREGRPAFPTEASLLDVSTSPILGHIRQLLLEGTRALNVSWLRNGHLDSFLAITVLVSLVIAALQLFHGKSANKSRRWIGDIAALLVVGFALRSVLISGAPEINASGANLLQVAALRDQLANPQDATVVLASEEVPVLWAHDRWRGETYGVNRDDIRPGPTSNGFMEGVVSRHDRVWLLASNVSRSDPLNGVEALLDRSGFRIQERTAGTARLVQFDFPPQMAGPKPDTSIPRATFVERNIQLLWAVEMIDPDAPYRRLVEIEWSFESGSHDGVSMFVHLYKGDRLVGQADASLSTLLEPRVSNAWRGNRIRTHHTIEISDRVVDQSVTTAIGLYRASDGSRLTPVDANGREFAEKRVPIDRR